MQEYYLERINSNNLSDLDILHEAVYGHRPASGFYKKKYAVEYTGKGPLGYFAYNMDKAAISYYGVLPCLLQHNNEIILAAQSTDTMTHPNFRYKGLFVELSKMTLDLCRQEGVQLAFGFPNQNSYHGFVTKLGWTQTENMVCYKIVVNALPIQGIANRFYLKLVYKQYKDLVLNKYRIGNKGIKNNIIEEGYTGLCRNDDYLAYKTFSNTEVWEIGHSKVWIKIDQVLFIGDMELHDDLNFVISVLQKIAKQLGIKNILFITSTGTKLQKAFERQYTGQPSYPVLFKDLGTVLALDKIKFTFADIDIF